MGDCSGGRRQRLGKGEQLVGEPRAIRPVPRGQGLWAPQAGCGVRSEPSGQHPPRAHSGGLQGLLSGYHQRLISYVQQVISFTLRVHTLSKTPPFLPS